MTSDAMPGLTRTLLTLFALGTGCATPLIAAAPERFEGQHETFHNGTPLLLSQGERSDVAVSPWGGPTGRYELTNRIPFLVYIRNRSAEAFFVSERHVSARVRARDEYLEATVLLATQLEDEVREKAAHETGANAFALAASSFASASAGTTYHEFRGGNTTVTGTTHDPAAAERGRREALADAQARQERIDSRARADLDRVATLLQANTVEPGGSVTGGVIIERPSVGGCDPSSRPHDCSLLITVSVAGDIHRFQFREGHPQ